MFREKTMPATITKPEELTDRQRELITGAMENRGRLMIAVRADSNGKAVRGKDKTVFFDPDDRDVAGLYIEELVQLERVLLMRQDGGRSKYELTNLGWLVGRKLRERR